MKKNNFGVKSNRLIALILALTVLKPSVQQKGGHPKYKTVFIAELFRHGARTTTKVDKANFPFTSEIGFGNLTGNGQRMQFLLGQQIRKNYSELFNTGSGPSNFDYLLYSSPIPRCIVSANSHMLGLYPPGPTAGDKVSTSQTGDGLKYMSPPGDEVPDVVFNNQTFPSALPSGVRVFPILNFQNIDYMFLHNGRETCPGMGSLKSQIDPKTASDTLDVTETAKQMEAAGLKAEIIFGQSTWTTDLLDKFFDQARAYLYYKGEQFPGMTEDLYTQTRMIASWHFSGEMSGGPKVAKFHTTTISEQLLVNMNNKINGTNSKLKYLMFSGHDSTVYPFMHAHKIINGTCSKQMYETYMLNKTVIKDCQFLPEFSSSFLWELNKNSVDGEYYVRVLYNAQPIHFCQDNQDDYYCKFSDFEAEVQSRLILPDFMEICKGSGGLWIEHKVYQSLTFIFMATTAFLAVMVVTLMAKLRKRAKGGGVSQAFETRLTEGQEGGKRYKLDQYKDAEEKVIHDRTKMDGNSEVVV